MDMQYNLVAFGLVHQFIFKGRHPFLTQGDDGLWRYAERPDSLPLMFSLKATKE